MSRSGVQNHVQTVHRAEIGLEDVNLFKVHISSELFYFILF